MTGARYTMRAGDCFAQLRSNPAFLHVTGRELRRHVRSLIGAVEYRVEGAYVGRGTIRGIYGGLEAGLAGAIYASAYTGKPIRRIAFTEPPIQLRVADLYGVYCPMCCSVMEFIQSDVFLDVEFVRGTRRKDVLRTRLVARALRDLALGEGVECHECSDRIDSAMRTALRSRRQYVVEMNRRHRAMRQRA